MDLKVISWNVRGLGRLEKAGAIRNLIRVNKPQILFIQETKLSAISPSLLRRLGCDANFEHLHSPAEGSSEGILNAWDSRFFTLSESVISRRFIAVFGKFRGHDKLCGLVNIYGPSIDNEKEDFFKELLEIINAHNAIWCLGGDFNAITSRDDKLGFSWNFQMMEVFRSFIQDACLIDLPLHGGAFTWSNNRDPPTHVRLDRFLIDNDFLLMFPNANQCLLPKAISDHNAIVLEHKVPNWGKKPFRFYNYLLLEDGFDELITRKIADFHSNTHCADPSSLIKILQGAAKHWFTNHKNSLLMSSFDLENRISTLELKLQQGSSPSATLKEILELKEKLWAQLRRDESIWLQNSRLR
ncbi:hypothetical protein HRI_002722900 [Hibiscus trionum]|uniref:Endonuclease/exonuclease/phosphatase domain-containing protein n=1 Tax=Hibiscus trionum TaxID=183268 RepID=A0A9W7I8J7_HIBTR|nr:hypothetical protein HRI_002722900 [Hibiscus trionum]